MKTLLLDVYNDCVRKLDIEDELDQYYKWLDCDLIDVVVRTIGGREFDIVCDEEGTFRPLAKISAINDMGEPMLVGNLIFLHHDEAGAMTGLTDDDIEHLRKYIKKIYTNKFPAGYPAVCQMEYVGWRV